MAENKARFEWNSALFEDYHGRFSKLQMGLIGLALGLMLMDLTKIYTLLPLAFGFLWVSLQQRKVDSLRTDYEGAAITLSPRSVLIEQPAQQLEKRIPFHDIQGCSLRQKGYLVTLVLERKEAEPLELPGFIDAPACCDAINQALDNKRVQSAE